MRKKSHVTVQKWVDSIAVTEEEKNNCDSNELNISEPSTSGSSGAGVKGKLTEICSKFNVNEKLKSKKIELKNLISKTTQKIKKESSKDIPESDNMDQKQTNDKCDNDSEQIINDNNDVVNKEEIDDENETSNKMKSDEVVDDEEEADVKSEPSKLTVQRHIGILGRSCSENPNPPSRNKRLSDIGRSFSVANDSELPRSDSTDNLIYDVDEDISIVNPSFNTSPSVLSNKTNSNNQLDRNIAALRLGHVRPLREHTVSEGHYSPHVVPKNPLLRDSSFQVRLI